MKKRIISLSIAFILVFIYALPVFAADSHAPRVVDNSDLLTAEEEQSLSARLDEMSERLKADVAVITVVSLDGKSAQDYTDDYFIDNKYGIGKNEDGVMLMICLESRDWHIATHGKCIRAFTDEEIQNIGNEMSSYLANGSYATAFDIFAKRSEENIKGLKTQIIKAFFISLAIGLIAAFLIITKIKADYKPVRFKSNASDYLVQDSLQLTGAFDTFLYSNVSKTARSDSSSGGSSTHRSSSGSTFGGGGGKF